MLNIDKEKCIACGVCNTVCPVPAIHESADGKYEIIADECMECYACKNSCTEEAIFESEAE